MYKFLIILFITSCSVMPEIIVTQEYDISGIPMYVTDGDTIRIGDARIRLYGIDAPETDQAYGDESTSMLEYLIGNSSVDVEVVDIDRYGRYIGKIYVDGVYLNLEMVKQGCAWYYYDYADDRDLEEAELEARRYYRGLWASNPIPPWEWRRM